MFKIMKSLFLSILFSCLFISCEREENSIKNTTIIGTWKLTQAKISDGGIDTKWRAVKNGYEYTFNTDSTFTSTEFSNCSTGRFTTSGRILALRYDCENFNTGHENAEGKQTRYFRIENKTLFLNPSTCIEECTYKLKKVK